MSPSAAGGLPACGSPRPGIHTIAFTRWRRGRAFWESPAFREGFACLGALGLAFDAWVYHTQLDEVAALAAAFPGTAIVLNHVGSPILGGPYAGRFDAAFAEWSAGMVALARQPNVSVKLGALPIRLPGAAVSRDAPPSSAEVATAWRPFVDHCIELFGAERCMFESNFPVQKRWCSYAVVWNAFKRLAAGASADAKAALFHATAARVYGVPLARQSGVGSEDRDFAPGPHQEALPPGPPPRA